MLNSTCNFCKCDFHSQKNLKKHLAGTRCKIAQIEFTTTNFNEFIYKFESNFVERPIINKR
jgi:hypothetical protein